MDQPIRPKPSNHHKPRIRSRSFLGIWTTYEILLPKYRARHTPEGTITLAPNGYLTAAESRSLAKAMHAAVDLKKEHMPWMPA